MNALTQQSVADFLDDHHEIKEIEEEIVLEQGEIDPRIKSISYSSLLSLHSCPRKFQLAKLSADIEEFESDNSKITFAFGHVVGHGIQRSIESKSEQDVIWEMFLMWDADLLDANPKQNKSFWLAVMAVQKFRAMQSEGFLHDYELVFHNGKPACELGFVINFPGGFRYRGFVDVVLRHKYSGKVLVLELKTSSATNINPAMYKNSAQAIGYSIVLDVLFPDLSSYEVLYLIYQSKSYEYNSMVFTKTYLQRALWIKELLMDIEMISMYESNGVFPMHGESCYSFYRECEYINICQLSTESIAKKLTQKVLDKIASEEYSVNLTLADLIESQLSKSTA